MSKTSKSVSISGPCYKKLRAACRQHQKPISPVVERIVSWALDNENASPPIKTSPPAKKRTVNLLPILAEVAREKKLLLPVTEEEIAAAEAEVADQKVDLPPRLQEPPRFQEPDVNRREPENNKPKLHAGTPVTAVPMTPRGKGNVESF